MCIYKLVNQMITDIQKRWLQLELEGKITKKQDPRKYSAYRRRIREHVIHMRENLLWLAEHCPEILQDRDYENSDETIPRYSNARALLKVVTLFENEPTVLSLIAEIYSSFQLELLRKE